jgi:hypothetical protein
MCLNVVIPAEAGIHFLEAFKWTPAFAGVTYFGILPIQKEIEHFRSMILLAQLLTTLSFRLVRNLSCLRKDSRSPSGEDRRATLAGMTTLRHLLTSLFVNCNLKSAIYN